MVGRSNNPFIPPIFSLPMIFLKALSNLSDVTARLNNFGTSDLVGIPFFLIQAAYQSSKTALHQYKQGATFSQNGHMKDMSGLQLCKDLLRDIEYGLHCKPEFTRAYEVLKAWYADVPSNVKQSMWASEDVLTSVLTYEDFYLRVISTR